MINKRSSAAFLIAALCATHSAFAHPGHHFQGVMSGVAHPILGVDHLLAMVAVGLWAAQLGGRALWMVPGAFVALMAAGGALGTAGMPMPFVESGIAVSVLLMGLLIVSAAKAPLAASIPLVGLFALFHGHAHGAELPADAAVLSYSIGFLAATVALLGTGMGLGLLARRLISSRVLFRTAGAAISVCGLLLLVDVIKG
jgi:urease accessory protein